LGAGLYNQRFCNKTPYFMPIYAYKCEACGHAKDVLQKISDARLTVCPACGAEAFQKQLTSAGFQLKGSGWYVTDFRGGEAGKASDGANSGVGTEAKAETKADTKTDTKAADSASAPAAASVTTASPAPSPAPAPAAKAAAAPSSSSAT
jgi:putative FmdB family regulatory protein